MSLAAAGALSSFSSEWETAFRHIFYDTPTARSLRKTEGSRRARFMISLDRSDKTLGEGGGGMPVSSTLDSQGLSPVLPLDG